MSSWTESDTEHFHCRHSSVFTADAARVLALLERTRERLTEQFRVAADEPTVVLHDRPVSLGVSNPFMAAIWTAGGRTSRRYVVGWAGRRELHLLAPAALRERASGVSGSYEMLALAPASLYMRWMIMRLNPDLKDLRPGTRSLTALRWAWLLEGAPRWFSGESSYSRAAIGLRMRDGRRPHFPPGPRDAPLLAAPLIELLAQHSGEAAVYSLCMRPQAGGAHAALAHAFRDRSLMAVESDWRSELRRLAEGR